MHGRGHRIHFAIGRHHDRRALGFDPEIRGFERLEIIDVRTDSEQRTEPEGQQPECRLRAQDVKRQEAPSSLGRLPMPNPSMT